MKSQTSALASPETILQALALGWQPQGNLAFLPTPGVPQSQGSKNFSTAAKKKLQTPAGRNMKG